MAQKYVFMFSGDGMGNLCRILPPFIRTDDIIPDRMEHCAMGLCIIRRMTHSVPEVSVLNTVDQCQVIFQERHALYTGCRVLIRRKMHGVLCQPGRILPQRLQDTFSPSLVWYEPHRIILHLSVDPA